MLYENILETIGNTPLVRLHKIEEKYDLKAHLYAKVESFNPSGSVKDRASYWMLKKALDNNNINKDTILIEQTSGNTGIGLSMVAAYLGMKLIIVMPDTMSMERIKLMEAYGARVVLSDGKHGMQGAVDKVEEIKNQYPNHFVVGQFTNLDNREIHYMTTGVEIYRDLPTIDAFVAGIGTGGTISGVGKYLKEHNKDIKVFGVEPLKSNILNGGKAAGHTIQGIGANFIPEVLDCDIYDGILDIKDEEAKEMMKVLAQEEGIFVGISAGAALSGALKIANDYQNIVIVLPDSGSRYLSVMEG